MEKKCVCGAIDWFWSNDKKDWICNYCLRSYEGKEKSK